MRKISLIERLALSLIFLLGFGVLPVPEAGARTLPPEKTVLNLVADSEKEGLKYSDKKCRSAAKYHLYLIDNFEQPVRLVPEIETSHGEMLLKILLSGRDDLEVTVLNTSLSKGLAIILEQLYHGRCADAVVSSIPGSNYTYAQVNSFFKGEQRVSGENILKYRRPLLSMLRNIALEGFPSVQWLEGLQVNSTKLANDARKVVFIETLGRMGIPVFLPYGNADTRFKGEIRSVNLLSLPENAQIYSALDEEGRRVRDFPYSPLSSGDEPAVYDILECPDKLDPLKAHLDINADGFFDYSFKRSGEIPFVNGAGEFDFAPNVLEKKEFEELLREAGADQSCNLERDLVLTAGQFQRLREKLCPDITTLVPKKRFVWLRPTRKETQFIEFDPACYSRGKVSGTSIIPPNKLKEFLPPKP